VINLDGKIFKSVSNSENGEVSEETRFHYQQKDKIIWATYEGGQIKFGTLSGEINEEENSLEFQYQHQNINGEFLSGYCTSYLIESENEGLCFEEHWKWTCRDFSSGTSTIQEVVGE